MSSWNGMLRSWSDCWNAESRGIFQTDSYSNFKLQTSTLNGSIFFINLSSTVVDMVEGNER